MRSWSRVVVVLALFALTTTSCKRRSSGKTLVAVSIFPLYDIARRIAGDRLEVVLVLPPGRSEHSYDPTPKEMARVADARLAVAVGLELDDWIVEVMSNATGDRAQTLTLGPRVNPRSVDQEEVGEEAAEQARAHTAHALGEEEHEHGPVDPHFWMDPVRMMKVVDELVAAFVTLDPAGASAYRTRGDALKQSLSALDAKISARRKTWSRSTIVTFHGSMAYFAARYDLTIAAVIEPFPGREPTPRYLQEVLAVIAQRKPAVLLSEPQLDRVPAQRVAELSHVPLLEIDPIGGTEGVDSYERLMNHNTDVLEQALR